MLVSGDVDTHEGAAALQVAHLAEDPAVGGDSPASPEKTLVSRGVSSFFLPLIPRL